jgi:hypothetical protein
VEKESVFHRVRKYQIIPDRDLVIEIVPGERMPMASITDPQTRTASELMPVPQALKVVADEMSLEPYYLEIVVVDEDGLWNVQWGRLVAHPSRLDSKSALSL